MSKTVELTAEKRDGAGKGAARKARKDNLVPAVIYGQKKDPETINVCFNLLLKLLNQGGFKQAEILLTVDGKTQKVKAQALQLHPVRNVPIHVDFLRID